MPDLEMRIDKSMQGTASPSASILTPYLAAIRLILKRHVEHVDARLETEVCVELGGRIAAARPSEGDLVWFIRSNLHDVIKGVSHLSASTKAAEPNPMLVVRGETFLRTLPARKRQALLLYYLDGFPAARIVQVTGMPATELAELLNQVRGALGSEVARGVAATGH